MTSFLNQTLTAFLDQAAARQPAPGGGSAAAGLTAIVARFSAPQVGDSEELAIQARQLWHRAAALVDEDARASQGVLATRRDRGGGAAQPGKQCSTRPSCRPKFVNLPGEPPRSPPGSPRMAIRTCAAMRSLRHSWPRPQPAQPPAWCGSTSPPTLACPRAPHPQARAVFVNRVGAKGELVFWGGSHLVDPGGRTVAEASLYTEELVIADVGLADVAPPPPRDALVENPRLGLLLQELSRLTTKPRGGGSAGLAAARLGS